MEGAPAGPTSVMTLNWRRFVVITSSRDMGLTVSSRTVSDSDVRKTLRVLAPSQSHRRLLAAGVSVNGKFTGSLKRYGNTYAVR